MVPVTALEALAQGWRLDRFDLLCLSLIGK
jgi:hypothetical protein